MGNNALFFAVNLVDARAAHAHALLIYSTNPRQKRRSFFIRFVQIFFNEFRKVIVLCCGKNDQRLASLIYNHATMTATATIMMIMMLMMTIALSIQVAAFYSANYANTLICSPTALVSAMRLIGQSTTTH